MQKNLEPVGNTPVRDDLTCGYTTNLTATDKCGNTATPVTQIVTVIIDTEDPVLPACAIKTVACDEEWSWDEPSVSDTTAMKTSSPSAILLSATT
ncbi:MAG: hypothetical protein R2806_13045 [Saprospiraceae bacterium]